MTFNNCLDFKIKENRMFTNNNKNDNEFQVIDSKTASITDEEMKQKIFLQGNDNSNTYPIYSTDTDIFLSKNSSQSRINASNKIKVNKIVNFEWEQRYSYGNMIAVHKSGQYFAYAIRVDNSGKVKVFNKKLNEKVLLRSFRGRVVDLSFAYYDQEVLLGCVDETGCLQIFRITLDPHSKMQTTVVFNLAPLGPNPKTPIESEVSPASRSLNQTPKQGVSSPSGQGGSIVNRIIWCNYIPDSPGSSLATTNDDQPQQTEIAEEASKVFVLTRKNRADIFHLDLIRQTYDCTRQLETDELIVGHLVIDEHKSTILTASFSPDGSAIASSSSDGEVNFFKISFSSNGNNNNKDDDDDEDTKSLKISKQENQSWDKNDDENEGLVLKADRSSTTTTLSPPSPKCLQKWKPHDNKPVTSLYFLDDVKNPSPDAQLWSFILTGADFNREIKLWCCIKWECLQTINFLTQSNEESNLTGQQNLPAPLFKTAIDLTSTYLVMSDITRKCFFVLHLFQDTEKKRASCTAISEYILAYPALSFAIIDSYKAKARKYNQLNTSQSQLPNSLTQEDLNSSEGNSLDLDNNTTLQASNNNTDLCTMIRLYCIQTKQLQEMQIFLSGEQSINAYNNSSTSLSPPPIQSLLLSSNNSFTKNSTLTSTNQSLSMSLTSQDNQSILHKLLPNASSPIKFNNSLSHLTNKKFMTLSTNNRLKGSTSFNSELSDDLNSMKNENNDHNKSLNHNNMQDSAIIQIVTPNLQLTNSSSVLANPVLLTPDAFINSPTNNNRSNSRTANVEQSQQQSIKNDILQSLLINSVSSSTSTTQSNNSNNNLLSSRTSSLTHVTAPLNNNNVTSSGVVVPVPVPATSTSANQLNLLSNNNKIKQRNNSSSSCSSTSSSTSTSSSSSIQSYVNNMDLTDKEVASLSAKNCKLSKSLNNQNNMTKSNQKTESLLNKVVIDNDNDEDSFLNPNDLSSRVQNEELMQPQQQLQPSASSSSFQLNSKSFNLELNQNWQANEPENNEMKSLDSNANLEEYELKSLLVQMTKTLKLQNEEIESLKRSQINSQHMLKSHIDTTFKQFLSNQQQYQRNSQSTISSNDLQQTLVMHNLQSVVEKIIKEEINKLIQSQFAQHILDPLREQISRELADKLKSIENVFKDSVLKLFKSKSTMDTLSQSIVGSMQSSIVNSYRETFQKVIVPNFEKSCQNMYQQVNSSFAKGTQDYLIEFDQLAKQHRKMFDDNKEPLLLQMKQFSEQMQLHGTQVANSIASNLQQQIESNLRNTNAVLQDTIISSVKAIIKEELHLAMHDQQITLPDILLNQIRQSGSISSICHTPNSEQNGSIFNSQQQQQDTQFQITQHLKKGAINNAFQVALCAADLNLLENLCELVSPSQAFDAKSKLQQPVILSLIQQLSQDLNSNTELKLKYLEEAIVNLDLNVPLTIEHTPIVMNQLIVKLQQHIQMHPNDKSAKQCKMLLLASKSLNSQKHSNGTQSLITTVSLNATNFTSQQNKITLPMMQQQINKNSLMHHEIN